MSDKIDIGSFTAIKKADGTFEYTPKDKVLQKKKVKPQYKERPQYKLIEHYESAAKLRFQTELHTTVKEIVKFIKNI